MAGGPLVLEKSGFDDEPEFSVAGTFVVAGVTNALALGVVSLLTGEHPAIAKPIITMLMMVFIFSSSCCLPSLRFLFMIWTPFAPEKFQTKGVLKPSNLPTC
jgi:hypothetical protein